MNGSNRIYTDLICVENLIRANQQLPAKSQNQFERGLNGSNRIYTDLICVENLIRGYPLNPCSKIPVLVYPATANCHLVTCHLQLVTPPAFRDSAVHKLPP